MRVIKPPQPLENPNRDPAVPHITTVFLAGSIEMGKAVDWQTQVQDLLQHTATLIFNPRRDSWDSSWEQSITNPQFKGQVDWELDALETVDVALFYFDPKTMSPITLMELGLLARVTPEKMCVCCPDGFWRKGNVDVVCQRYGVKQVNTIEELSLFVQQQIVSRLLKSTGDAPVPVQG